MAKLNIAPTKSNQIAIKHTLALATNGFNLLEQKQEILVMGLMRLLDKVNTLQAEVDQRRERAYQALRYALVRNGYYVAHNIAASVQCSYDVKVGSHMTAGVRTPTITVTPGEIKPQFSFVATDSTIDRTMTDFIELAKIMAQMAEMESAVWLMARELKKTQRRVNALEHIFLPEYKETLHFINGALEEKEQENFFTMKMVKKKLEAENNQEYGGENGKI